VAGRSTGTTGSGRSRPLAARVVCQWPDQGIEMTIQDLDAERSSPRHVAQSPLAAAVTTVERRQKGGLTHGRAAFGRLPARSTVPLAVAS
jgi:hypothetical protein